MQISSSLCTQLIGGWQWAKLWLAFQVHSTSTAGALNRTDSVDDCLIHPLFRSARQRVCAFANQLVEAARLFREHCVHVHVITRAVLVDACVERQIVRACDVADCFRSPDCVSAVRGLEAQAATLVCNHSEHRRVLAAHSSGYVIDSEATWCDRHGLTDLKRHRRLHAVRVRSQAVARGLCNCRGVYVRFDVIYVIHLDCLTTFIEAHVHSRTRRQSDTGCYDYDGFPAFHLNRFP